MNTRFEGIKLLQREDGYKVTQDSVLLANFIECNFASSLIDLGTGSGIILLLISQRCKGKNLYGIELNEEQYKIARKNIELNNKKDIIHIIHGDIKNIKDFFKPDAFDVVVTNPPYYGKNEGIVSSNPERKLAKVELAIDLPLLFKVAFYLLKERGSFYFIYPTKKLQSVFFTARRFQFAPKVIRFIHYNIERKSELFLIKLVKRANEGLIVDAPVVIQEGKNL